MTTLGLSADELLSTTRSVRKRLDLDRPVDPALVEECLEYAVQAPTGSNSQSWQFLVVTDGDKRQALGDIYRKGWEAYAGMSASAASLAVGASEDRADQQLRVMGSAAHLAENFHRVPVMLIPCLPGRIDQWPGMGAVSALAGIIPSTWSFMLAARERGLGTGWRRDGHPLGDLVALRQALRRRPPPPGCRASAPWWPGCGSPGRPRR